MKVDMIGFGIKVVLKNTGNDMYMSYPRDIEGTIIEADIDTGRDHMKVVEGNYRGLFDVADSAVNMLVRWDTDKKSWHSTQNLYVRSFGTCPGYDSLWEDGEYRLDTRPFSALKPISRRAENRSTNDTFFDKLEEIKWAEPTEIDLSEIDSIIDEAVTKKVKLTSRHRDMAIAYGASYGSTTGRSISTATIDEGEAVYTSVKTTVPRYATKGYGEWVSYSTSSNS